MVNINRHCHGLGEPGLQDEGRSEGGIRRWRLTGYVPPGAGSHRGSHEERLLQAFPRVAAVRGARESVTAARYAFDTASPKYRTGVPASARKPG